MMQRTSDRGSGRPGLMLPLVALGLLGGCTATQTDRPASWNYESRVARQERNLYLQPSPMDSTDRGVQWFARIVAPVELPFCVVVDTAFAPFALLDYKLPAYPLTCVWWSLITTDEAIQRQTKFHMLGLEQYKLDACLKEAYAGNREEALRRADRILAKASHRHVFRYLIPAQVYVMFGETPLVLVAGPR